MKRSTEKSNQYGFFQISKMNIYDIAAYGILGIVVVGLIIVITIKLLWKSTHTWFPLLSFGQIVGFYGAHLILLSCAIACIVLGFWYGGIWNGDRIDTKVQQEIKNETNSLIEKSVSAEKKLSNIPETPSDDLIKEMFNISTIATMLEKQFQFVVPNDYGFAPFSRSYDPVKVEIEKSTSCALVKKLPLLTTAETIEALEKSLKLLRGYSVHIFLYFKQNNEDQQISMKLFEEEVKKGTIHAGNIKTTLTKAWKSSVLQYENAVDTRVIKVSEQHQSIFLTSLLTIIGLLCIPFAVIVMFIIVSVAVHLTNQKSKFHRFLFISNHICYYFMALLILGCAACIVYTTTYATKNESSIANDDSKYFDFPIPTYDNSTKSSYNILSKSSGNLFDPPNNDILIGELVFFDNWETQLVNGLNSVMEDDETKNEFVKHSQTISEKWGTLEDLNTKLSKILEDSTCSASFPAINGFLKQYGNAHETMKQHMKVLPNNIASWKQLPDKLSEIVKERVQVVKSSVEKRRNHINDGINILSIDSKSTKKTFAKINDIQGSKSDENMRGIVVLLYCMILMVLFGCAVLYLFTYRRFGPQPEEAKSPTSADSEPHLEQLNQSQPNKKPTEALEHPQQMDGPIQPQEQSKKPVHQHHSLEVDSTQLSPPIYQPSQKTYGKENDARKPWVQGIVKLSCGEMRSGFIKHIQPRKCTKSIIDSDTMKKKYSKNENWPYYEPCIIESKVNLNGREDNCNFFHANYIKIKKSKRKYIASCGPPTLEDVPDFYHMLYHEKVRVVVMLCPLDEQNTIRYFPTTLDASTLTFGDYTMKLVKFEKCAISDVVCRVLELSCASDGGEQKKITIKHIHYSAWRDKSVPADEKERDVLRIIDLAKKWNAKYDDASPIFVHCNDGVGRTGTFIAIDYCDQSLGFHLDQDLRSNIQNLRDMRHGAIEKATQFVFVIAALVRKYQCLNLITAKETRQFWDDYQNYIDPSKSAIKRWENQI